MKKVFLALFFLSFIFCLSSKANAYLLGFKSRDNTISNIQQIEEQYSIRLPIVSFIFDPYGDAVINTIKKLPTTLGLERIYHISLSSNSLTAQEVADGKFDKQYKEFFSLVKSGDVKVIFRTMHEMNGGRYPRSSKPEPFKKAWIRVWNLSRQAGLTTQNILFDFSLNARDLPEKSGNPNQRGVFVSCMLSVKAKLKCPTFEDYYPGAKYVDLMGVTFYNWWKGNSNRRRGTPRDIVNAKWWNTLDRMKTFGKPIFIDEVGTTAVNYAEAYSFKKSLEIYQNTYTLKNEWLLQLRDFLKSEPTILGANYFNVDLTNGLKNWTLGELDRSVIDLQSNKFYEGIMDVINAWEKIEKNSNNLLNLFNMRYLNLSGARLFVTTKYFKPIQDLYAIISTGKVDQLAAIQSLEEQGIHRLYKRFDDKDAKAIADVLRKILVMQQVVKVKK